MYIYIQCIYSVYNYIYTYNVYEKTWTEGCPALPGTNIPGGDSIFKTPVVNSGLQMILKHSLVTIKNVQMFLIHHPLVNIQPDPLMSDSGGVLHRLCPVLDLKT